MIKKITIRDVASYDSEGVIFDDLQRVNIIYGGNGTGKTTISRVLASSGSKTLLTRVIGTEDYRAYFDCDVKWEGRSKEIVVYNKDFKKKNLTEVMPGVFSMGPDVEPIIERSRAYRERLRYLHSRGLDDYALRNSSHIEDLDEVDEKFLYSVIPAIQYINRMLQKIGFTGFKLQKSRNNDYCYEIVRENGTRAGETLSEGEVTIITFLYYMQLVRGIGSGNNPNSEKVAVIDDPISSLDYEALGVVSELTNELIRDAHTRVEQVIVLTHNTAYHQSLAVRQSEKDTHYWRLYKRKGVSKAKDCGKENQVTSDYGELWRKLREARDAVDSGECIDVINLPNTMRRIVETYFVECGGYNRIRLFAGGYVKNPEDKQDVVSLMKWIDEGSHGVNDNQYTGNAETLVENNLNAMRLLFKTMGQQSHYQMMMREE